MKIIEIFKSQAFTIVYLRYSTCLMWYIIAYVCIIVNKKYAYVKKMVNSTEFYFFKKIP